MGSYWASFCPWHKQFSYSRLVPKLKTQKRNIYIYIYIHACIAYAYNIYVIRFMRIFIWKNGRVSAQTMACLCTVDQTILLLLSDAQLFRFIYLSRYFFLLPCVGFGFPIVPMGVSIPAPISLDIRIEIHLAFVGIVVWADPFHHNVHPPSSSDPINHPSDTVYLSFTSFAIMGDGRALVSFLNDADIILTLIFFKGNGCTMASFNLVSPFPSFFLQCSVATSAFQIRVCVPLLICRPRWVFIFFIFYFFGNILLTVKLW